MEAMQLKITDLPRDLSVNVPEGVTEAILDSLKESLRSQVLYNSRLDDGDASVPDILVTVINHTSNQVSVRLEAGTASH